MSGFFRLSSFKVKYNCFVLFVFFDFWRPLAAEPCNRFTGVMVFLESLKSALSFSFQ